MGLTVGWSSNSPPTVRRGQGRLFPARLPEARPVLDSGPGAWVWEPERSRLHQQGGLLPGQVGVWGPGEVDGQC